MTTSVFYDSEMRVVDVANDPNSNQSAGVTVSTIYNNLTSLLTTGVTLVQQKNNSASTTNPTATFTSTPTNGNAMIAIVVRGSDNISSTNGSWTQLTATGSAGARRLEIWWRRAGASEPTAHTWTNATAALWEVTLLEFSGWATLADPIVIFGAGNLTSGTTATFGDAGMLDGVCAVVTSGGSAGTFTNTSTNGETVTDLPFTTTTRFRAMLVDAYANKPESQGNQITWTTSRVCTRAAVGWPSGSEVQLNGGYGNIVGNDIQTSDDVAGQIGLRFDTSTIPDTDTVSAATLTLTSDATPSWPANTAVNVYSLAAASISASNSNTRAVWKTPTEIGALTRVATRAAGSAWAGSTAYAWTSDATFPAAVNKTGSTTLLLATGDQASGTLRSTQEYANISSTSGSVHYLTVVHSFVGSATIAATLTVTPTVSKVLAYARTIAASLDTVPVLSRVASFARTIANTITTSPIITYVVTYLPGTAGLPRTLVFKVRDTLALPMQSKLALKVRSLISLREQ